MKLVVYKLTSRGVDKEVSVTRIYPEDKIWSGFGGLEDLSLVGLPPISEEEMIAIELWPEGIDSEQESESLKALEAAGCKYVAHEHHDFFYNLTVLISTPK